MDIQLPVAGEKDKNDALHVTAERRAEAAGSEGLVRWILDGM